MNNLIRFLSAVFVAIALTMPAVAQSRHNGSSNRQTTERKTQTTGRQSGSQNNRQSVNSNTGKKDTNQNGRKVGNQPNRGKDNNSMVDRGNNTGRPSNGHQGQPNNPQIGSGPGNQQNQMRPGQQPPQNPGSRPGQQPPNQRPGQNPGGMGANSHHSPQPPLQRPPVAPNMRPDRPPMYPYSRPLPPPNWRPVGGPILSTILGITLGTAIDLSLNYLYNNGYMVDGYNSDVVYLRNVNQLNYVWPDAALYYGNYGLAGSRFIYSTPYYDLNRYNRVYRDLVRLYGNPINFSNVNGGYLATWFGVGNDYVQLQFCPEIINGRTTFLTTLSFGR